MPLKMWSDEPPEKTIEERTAELEAEVKGLIPSYTGVEIPVTIENRAVGMKVKRGRDIPTGLLSEDKTIGTKTGIGTIKTLQHSDRGFPNYSLVRWDDTGAEYWYRCGRSPNTSKSYSGYDLYVATEAYITTTKVSSGIIVNQSNANVGLRVRRGGQWPEAYSTQDSLDGKPGGGVITRVFANGTEVQVKWDNSREYVYSTGHNNQYNLYIE